MRLAWLGLFVLPVGWALAAAPQAQDIGKPEVPPPAIHMARFDYQLYTAGLHPIDFSVDVALDPEHYAIAVQGHTQGVVDFFVRWISHTVTLGRLVEGHAVPVTSRSLNRFHGTPRRISMDYRDGVPVTKVDPPLQQDDRDPVTPDEIPGTLDSTSAALDLVLRVAQGESCEARERVFDGRRRFDMVVSDRGVARLAANQYSPFGGEARVCDFTIQRIAGFNRRPSRGYESEQPAEVIYRSWSMAVLPGLPAMPVRLEGDGSLGHFHLYLVAAHPSDRTPSVADLD